MSTTSNYSRERQWSRIEAERDPWDIAIVGGGATGVGVAIDAAVRGYRVVLCEQHDFGKGTSSRSTKLVHGGVRYLKQGHIGLVRSALHERGLLRKNAPHLVHPLPNIVPVYKSLDGPYYALGMKVYDWLSGGLSLGRSRWLGEKDTVARVPTIERRGLKGGVLYWDAQFDDTRLLVNMTQTAIDRGAVCVNYAPVREIVKQGGRVSGVVVEDSENGKFYDISAKVLVNAAGPFSDAIRRLDDASAEAYIATSQGIHIVLDGTFLPGDTALMVPKTSDGRVVFAIPWHGHAMIGSTDTPIPSAPLEPRPMPSEIDFLLETIAPYLTNPPQRGDIRSAWAGVRPLFRGSKEANTAKLGRDHVIRVSKSGLVSIIGGKWTTYRKMAQDCVDKAAEVGGLRPAECRTHALPIHGATEQCDDSEMRWYGADGVAIQQLGSENPAWNERLTASFPAVGAQVVWALRQEMARTVEDVLARRIRMLFLDAAAAAKAAPAVAKLLAEELGRNATWQDEQCQQFQELAQSYALR